MSLTNLLHPVDTEVSMEELVYLDAQFQILTFDLNKSIAECNKLRFAQQTIELYSVEVPDAFKDLPYMDIDTEGLISAVGKVITKIITFIKNTCALIVGLFKKRTALLNKELARVKKLRSPVWNGNFRPFKDSIYRHIAEKDDPQFKILKEVIAKTSNNGDTTKFINDVLKKFRGGHWTMVADISDYKYYRELDFIALNTAITNIPLVQSMDDIDPKDVVEKLTRDDRIVRYQKEYAKLEKLVKKVDVGNVAYDSALDFTPEEALILCQSLIKLFKTIFDTEFEFRLGMLMNLGEGGKSEYVPDPSVVRSLVLA